MRIKYIHLRAFLVLFVTLLGCDLYAQSKTIWQIGEDDSSCREFALAPDQYTKFLEKDFGWEDKAFVVGHSTPSVDWPYILPGPNDAWGGTGPTSGIRSHALNILFQVEYTNTPGPWNLIIDLLDTSAKHPALFKVVVNGKAWKYAMPAGKNSSPEGNSKDVQPHRIVIPLDHTHIKPGGNEIQLTILQGSWIMFDQVKLEGPQRVTLVKPSQFFLRSVQAADYEIENNGKRFQPLIIDVEHLRGTPRIVSRLDGTVILDTNVETGRYQFEAPMPAVTKSTKSIYAIYVNDSLIAKGTVQRGAKALTTPANYVDTRMGTAHSRWMIAPGPWMPFSMVKLSPDNQPEGWQAGYDPTFESVGIFSHIHEWTMAGLGIMPTQGELRIRMDDEGNRKGYRSNINKATEQAPLGYYAVQLEDYGIKAELTSSTRCGFQRYTFKKGADARVLIDLQIPAEYRYDLKEVSLRKVNDYRVEGYSKQFTPNAWGGGISQEYTIHFVVEFDRPVRKFGVWVNDSIQNTTVLNAKDIKDAGAFAEFDTRDAAVVQVRTGISLVSIENAALNLKQEITDNYAWRFDDVRKNHERTWNDLLSRVAIASPDRLEKIRFYTNMYRALCSRNTWSDVNGKWVDANEQVQQFKKSDDVALGCDAFWNTFWNLNQFWNLVTPEWSSRWVRSQLAMYDVHGWLAKGPAGMEYIPVMVAEHEIPLIVSAYQMGIRDFDASKALAACVKMQTIPAETIAGGMAGNEDLQVYMKHHYVPHDEGRFSNSLEYSYDDYTVSQFARALGNQSVYQQFSERAEWWKNAVDSETGYARLRGADGKWFEKFDPFKSGANEEYVEGNAWQLTFFVPQNIPGLAQYIGEENFIKRLTWGFEESNKLRFNAPGDQYWDYPVIQGNQQSMHFAFLFNWVKRPWLTQQWSRAIVDRYYGYGVSNAYLGDEDQGQMSAWFIMASLGLFQTDGGTRAEPIYEIGSPLFEKVTIDLGQRYGRGKTFTIQANHASRTNKYIQRATLNGRTLDACWFSAKELLNGGELVLEMGPSPNYQWGLNNPPAAK